MWVFHWRAGNFCPFFCIIAVLLSLQQVGVYSLPGGFRVSQRSSFTNTPSQQKAEKLLGSSLFSFNCFL